MDKLNFKKGFTLLELLVVFAIIGILTALVFAGIADARKKGGDGKIKRQLQELRSQLELYYNRGANYGANTVSFYGECPTSFDNEPGWSHVFHADYKVFSLVQHARNSSVAEDAWCYSSQLKWVVAVKLKTSTDLAPASWCIDNTGTSKKFNGLPVDAVNSITGGCN